MNDTVPAPAAAVTEGTAKLVYLLYLVGLVIGITGLVGVVVAYVNRDGAPEWLQTHYRYQIRTFWIGALFMLVGGLLMVVLIGWVVLLLWIVWLIVRCVKGLQALQRQEAIADPGTWLF